MSALLAVHSTALRGVRSLGAVLMHQQQQRRWRTTSLLTRPLVTRGSPFPCGRIDLSTPSPLWRRYGHTTAPRVVCPCACPPSEDVFEGVEKRVDLHFDCTPDHPAGLRDVPREIWDEILSLAKCSILSHTYTTELDAYVLSESSLFVLPHRLILKTCGKTTPLFTLNPILHAAACRGQGLQSLLYSHSSFFFPSLQPFPHTSFHEEEAWLDRAFKGFSIRLGGGGSQQAFVAYMTAGHTVPHASPVLEVAMMDIDPSVAALFRWRDDSVFSQQVMRQAGIDTLVPSSYEIDAFCFQPCGYSMNAIRGKEYVTIHVTPEADCSYVSFETNAYYPNYGTLVSRVIDLFKPRRFAVHTIAPPSCDLCAMEDVHGVFPHATCRETVHHTKDHPFRISSSSFVSSESEEETPDCALAGMMALSPEQSTSMQVGSQ